MQAAAEDSSGDRPNEEDLHYRGQAPLPAADTLSTGGSPGHGPPPLPQLRTRCLRQGEKL